VTVLTCIDCCDAEARSDPPGDPYETPLWSCADTLDATRDHNQLRSVHRETIYGWCRETHHTIVGLVQAHPLVTLAPLLPIFDAPKQRREYYAGRIAPRRQAPEWTSPLDLWVSLRIHAPDILWGTTVRAMGKRLAREGWHARWKGNRRAYYLTDLPKGKTQ
jgi:hypothetical protein